MTKNLTGSLQEIYNSLIGNYLGTLYNNPIKLITFILDLALVCFLMYKVIKVAKETRAWQLLKGIIFFTLLIVLSNVLNFHILNFIITTFVTYGVVLIVIFQPELRRALEQIGTSKLSKFFGMDKDIISKTKENIYKIVIATKELSKKKTGALIVIERDVRLKDIMDTGIIINGEISPQLLVNIFNPKTPLHDGAVVISEQKIMAAACILPLDNDRNISRNLGTRHRSAVGISKETDSIVIVVSEETGKISVAKDGTLIVDVKEEALKQILMKNLIIKKYGLDKKEQV